MTEAASIILVVNRDRTAARHVKELIEFMDTPRVRTADPGTWRERVGRHHLEALFVGPDLSDDDLRDVLGDLEQVDPNVPIVILHGGQSR